MKRISIYYFLFCLIASLTIISCNEEDTSLRERLDKLEESSINSVEGQKASINKTIVYLKSIESSLDDYSRQAVITIEDSLQAYVDNELSGDVDWYTASVATLAQYEKVVSQLVLLSVYMSELCSEYSDSVQALSIKIDNAITSMQEWVNTSLTNYYNIAQVDAKIALLYAQILTSDSSTVTKIAQLREQLDSAKTELTQSYTEAISSAIVTNNGIIDTKIANEIATVNTRIDNEINALNLKIASLEGRISALEDRVNELSKQLGIFFSDNDVSCSPGDVVNIDYTLINATDTTAVYTLPSSGYKAKVTKKTKTTGTISVTVPNPIEDGTILIFVNNGDRTVTKSLNFISGSMSISADAVMVEADGGDISIDLSTDLQYTVKIPAEATWVHYKDITTKSAMRNEAINFAIDENATSAPRSAVIELKNNSGLTVGSATIRQSANVMQSNEIWYKTSDNQKIELAMPLAFGANIISNTYGKKGVIVLDAPITKLGSCAFKGCRTLTDISIPWGPTSVGEEAFEECGSLKNIVLPTSIKRIESKAFYYAFNNAIINLPDSLERIEEQAFSTSGITKINIPESVTFIGGQALCSTKIEEIVLPNSIKELEGGVFYRCYNLKRVVLPDSIREIPYQLFVYCNNLESIVLPRNISTIGHEAFGYCSKMKELTLYSPVKIDSYAFVSCNSLETINYFGYPLGLDCNSSFNKVYVEGITLRVPHNMKNFFKEVIGWKNFGIIEEVDSINLIQPQAIDLGLSVKWSSFNLGAQSPEQYGMYVAWGELFPKGNYDWSSYKWCDNVASSLTKYNSDESKGVVDNKLVLDMSDDAANYFLGGNWRIPTFEEISELANNNNCTWTWVCQNGVNGYMVTSKKDGYTDQSIFLPATGLSVGSGRSLTGSNARYWSSSRVISESQNAYMLWFSSGDHGSIQDARDVGFTIRPVCP